MRPARPTGAVVIPLPTAASVRPVQPRYGVRRKLSAALPRIAYVGPSIHEAPGPAITAKRTPELLLIMALLNALAKTESGRAQIGYVRDSLKLTASGHFDGDPAFEAAVTIANAALPPEPREVR